MKKKFLYLFEDKTELLVLIFFIIASILYLNLNGLPLNNPGNIKAADPFYHAIMVENILDTKQWNYYDFYISLNQEKYANSQPPLYYLNAAILSTFTKLPSWITIYFFMSLTLAFYIIVIYFLTKEIFENKKIALLASLFSILPFPVNVWLYPLYIGLWLQLVSNFFILIFIWLFIKYLKNKEKNNLFFIGLTLIGILLVHPQDLSVLFLPTLFLAYKILKNNYELNFKEQSNSNSKNFDKKLFIFNFLKNTFFDYLFLGLPFLIVFLVLLPKILFVWGSVGSNQFNLGFFGLRSNYFTNEYSGGLVFPLITFIPLFLIIIWILAIIQLYLNKEKYKEWLFVNFYFFVITYVLLIFIEQPYYFARLRTLTPYILYPSIAYFIIFILNLINQKITENYDNEKTKSNFFPNFFIIIIAVFLFITALPSYFSLKEQLKYEHIPIEKWETFNWIQENVPKDKKILFFGGIFQSEQIFTKRITAVLDMNEYINLVKKAIETNKTETNFIVSHGADTLRTNKIEVNFFKYKDANEPDKNVSLFDFDYVFFTNINKEIANANSYFINYYLNNGYELVYNKNGFIIIKKIL
ncbi:MAG: DUF6541 family protein [Candidatus Woesearchaeota archaeon]